MAESCVFCEIISGATDAAIVFDDEVATAFLDHRPLFPGHVLLAPRNHVQTLVDLPQDAVEPLFLRARALAGLMEAALGAQGSFVALNNKVSQSVPHLHIHVVPRKKKDGLRGFFWPRHKYDDAAHMERIRERLATAWTQVWSTS